MRVSTSREAPRLARVPRYRSLADSLIAQIRAGRLRVGQTMPGELELVERHAVSRHTVREALRCLEDLGLIARRQGVGTVITARRSAPQYVHAVRSPAELMRYPRESRLVLLGQEEVRAGRTLARDLGLVNGSRWCRLRALRRLGATRVALCAVQVYLLPEYAAVADSLGRRARPVYELIESRFGEKVERVQIEIRAGLVPAEACEALGVAAGSPSLRVIRRYLGRERGLFEVSVSEHPADRYSYGLELERGWRSEAPWSRGGQAA